MTATGLAAYGRVQDIQSFIRELGENIARSQMFGCENVQQGYVLATACVAKGRDPLSLAEDYHIIHGKLSMRADRMLAGLLERGGKYRVVERTADGADIEITYDGQTQRFSLSWSEAQAEPFTKWTDRKTGQTKTSDKYSTPRSRMQMLWARVVSDGVRTMCPLVLSGRYTPEELGDDCDDAIEVEVVAMPESQPTPSEPTSESIHSPCPSEQVDRIKRLIAEISQVAGYENTAAKIKAMLVAASLSKLADLSRVEADRLESALQLRQTSQFFETSLRGYVEKN